MRSAGWFVLASTSLLACGGIASSSTSGSGVGGSCPADDARPLASDTFPNAGAVLLSAGEGKFAAYAGFPFFGTYPSAAAAGAPCTCERLGIADPGPSMSAGTITLQSLHCGASLATLDPGGSGPPSVGYPNVTSLSWRPGELLDVTAAGATGGIAPFAGTLQTAQSLTGVMPAIGRTAQPPAVPLSADFRVTWLPEETSGAWVTFSLNQIADSGLAACTCTVKDAAGTMTIAASELKKVFVPSTSRQTTGSASLTRAVVRTFAVGNSSVDLVGETQTGGSVTFVP